MEAIVLETAYGLIRFAPANDERVDFACLQFLQRDALLNIHDLWLHSESLEHRQRGDEGAAIGKVDANGLPIEIPETADRFRRDDMYLFIVELGYIGELFLDVFVEALFLEIVERVVPHDPEVDALKKQNIGDALHRATADNGKHAQIVSIIEHGGQVRAELNIGAAHGAGYQRHGVRIQLLFGVRRADLNDDLN